jgi:hypothetical protein
MRFRVFKAWCRPPTHARERGRRRTSHVAPRGAAQSVYTTAEEVASPSSATDRIAHEVHELGTSADRAVRIAKTSEKPVMRPAVSPDYVLEKRLASRLLDVLIRAGLIVAVAMLCYRVFAPFLTLTVWGLILTVTLYPLHRMIADRMNGRQGIAATLLVLLGITLTVASTAVLMNSLGDTVQDFITRVHTNTVEIPSPPDGVAALPLVGAKLHGASSRAHDDMPGFVQSTQPKIGELASAGLGFVASIAEALLLFIGAFIPTGIFMTFGEPGERACQAISRHIVGEERGEEFTRLSAATIRAVAQGMVGWHSSRPFSLVCAYSSPACPPLFMRGLRSGTEAGRALRQSPVPGCGRSAALCPSDSRWPPAYRRHAPSSRTE